jgi:hypothetical protein
MIRKTNKDKKPIYRKKLARIKKVKKQKIENYRGKKIESAFM